MMTACDNRACELTADIYAGISPEISAQAQKSADRVRAAMAAANHSIFIIGDELCRIKDLLEHGQFTAWLDQEFRMRKRTAQRFMMVARRWLDAKRDTVTLLPPGTQYLLASPSTPQNVCDDVVRRVEAGERLDRKEIQLIVDRANGKAKKEAGKALAPEAPMNPDSTQRAGHQPEEDADAAAAAAFLRQHLDQDGVERLLEMMENTSWDQLRAQLVTNEPAPPPDQATSPATMSTPWPVEGSADLVARSADEAVQGAQT